MTTLSNYTFGKSSLNPFMLSLLYKKDLVLNNYIYPLTNSLNDISNGVERKRMTIEILSETNPDLFSSEKIQNAKQQRIEELKQRLECIKIKKNAPIQTSEYSFEEVKHATKKVCSVSFSKFYDSLENNLLNALPLIANMANAYAKGIDYEFYNYKDIITDYIACNYEQCWSRNDGILYAETEQGQVSFHVFENQDFKASINGLSANGRVWDENNAQCRCEEMFQSFLDDNSIHESIEINHEYEAIEEMFLKNEKYKSFKNYA